MKRILPYIIIAGLLGFLLYYLFRRKKYIIVYFSDADYPSVRLLYSYIKADIRKYPPTIDPNTVIRDIAEYDLAILIGGDKINPVYKLYMDRGILPKIPPNAYVIRQVGNFIFIAGWEAEDTYMAVKDFIATYGKQFLKHGST